MLTDFVRMGPVWVGYGSGMAADRGISDQRGVTRCNQTENHEFDGVRP
ncbi:hypothetical protein L0664_01160 [Octadecabacter sp. G9-8]|uniref:Uncharacterized protein n=1 Tax=Octadecabacter dasysiphoniae TaxID=2909341 RepID=A0ABS9CR02_9RHOB|nr:hypothetical protein [Octadecabacter dasysiphoniae]MCF2869661.1 hypothetical protein [Octadecabacter dasysiphoniae]